MIAEGGLRVRLTQIETFKDSQEKRVFFHDVDPTYGDYDKFMKIEDVIIRKYQKFGLLPEKTGGKHNLCISSIGNQVI